MYLGANLVPGMHEFVLNSRARRIQNFLREYLEERNLAARIIQKKWRLHARNRDAKQLKQLKLEHLRRKVAINRIYDLHRLIKVRKVTASAMLI